MLLAMNPPAPHTGFRPRVAIKLAALLFLLLSPEQSAGAQGGSVSRPPLDTARLSILRDLAWYHYWMTGDTRMIVSPAAPWWKSPDTNCKLVAERPITICWSESQPEASSYLRGPHRLTSHALDGPRVYLPIAPGKKPTNPPAREPLAPARLRAGADSARDNGWFVGHLLLLSTKAPLRRESLDILRSCRGSSGWCTALHAFIMDRYAYYREADSLFAIALDSLPRATSCRWRDIGGLLDSAARRDYAQLDCDTRRATEEHVWWLSDPLFLIRGNERRTAHYSRHVLDSLYAGGVSPFDRQEYSSPWRPELSDILLRYGPADWWHNASAPDKWPHEVISWGMQRAPNYSFVPRVVPLKGVGALRSDAFSLKLRLDSARERYRPDFDFVADLGNVQVAVFPRGDSMLVAATIDLEAEPIFEAAPFTAALFLGTAYDTRRIAVVDTTRSRLVRFVSRISKADHLASLEVLADTLRIAGRIRFGIAAPAERSVQMLFFDPAASLPGRVEDAIPLMRGRSRITGREPLGIYWELRGADSIVQMELTMQPKDPRRRAGVLRWVGSLFGGRSGAGARSLRWDERMASRDSTVARSLALDLTDLEEGEYTVKLSATLSGANVVTSERSITVTRAAENPISILVDLSQPLAFNDYAEDVPIMDIDYRCTLLTGRRCTEEKQRLFYPFRKWCPVAHAEDRWCKYRVDGIGRRE